MQLELGRTYLGEKSEAHPRAELPAPPASSPRLGFRDVARGSRADAAVCTTEVRLLSPRRPLLSPACTSLALSLWALSAEGHPWLTVTPEAKDLWSPHCAQVFGVTHLVNRSKWKQSRCSEQTGHEL